MKDKINMHYGIPGDEILFEACVDSIESALAAQQGGAGRVELCSALLEGGVTPSAGMTELVRKNLQIPVNVLIRPRSGDFCYTDSEFEVMKLDVKMCKGQGVDGIVTGILNVDGTIDKQRTSELIELAHPMSVTFHRAFDMTSDPYAAMETLIELNVDRILTSGQETSVLEGLDLLTDLIQKAGDRIIIMPGGGINERNIGKILSQCGAREFHATARQSYDSPMQYRNTHCFMGGTLRPQEFILSATNADKVNTLINAAVVRK